MSRIKFTTIPQTMTLSEFLVTYDLYVEVTNREGHQYHEAVLLNCRGAQSNSKISRGGPTRQLALEKLANDIGDKRIRRLADDETIKVPEIIKVPENDQEDAS